jgi:succinyl-CoA synthetase beta subunit
VLRKAFKELFKKYGVPAPKGIPVKSPAEFKTALAESLDGPVVVKSQIHAGGRGKGVFTDGFKGGVKFAQNKDDALEYAKKMFGNTLVTAQTGPVGRKIHTVYFTEACKIRNEYYLAILLDRSTSKPVIVASTEGGVEIEKVAKGHSALPVPANGRKGNLDAGHRLQYDPRLDARNGNHI